MRTLEEIKAELETLKPSLKKRFKVETIDIFGSYARKQATEKSDIDLLVTYCTTDYDYFTIIGLKKYLRKKMHIKDEVLKEAIPI